MVLEYYDVDEITMYIIIVYMQLLWSYRSYCWYTYWLSSTPACLERGILDKDGSSAKGNVCYSHACLTTYLDVLYAVHTISTMWKHSVCPAQHISHPAYTMHAYICIASVSTLVINTMHCLSKQQHYDTIILTRCFVSQNWKLRWFVLNNDELAI